MEHAHYVVGTAGHVDHGKTTLVRALTGHDTDRLPEEKSRGISIDLGFAPFTLPSGRTVSLVDVPGHEKFIRNMVAGASGIDLVLLVVAADEGVMPQTREHLAILELLGVSRGLTVLTKADLVEPDWLDMVRGDLEEELRGSFLADAPILIVSPVTGEGMPKLVATLESLLRETPRREARGFARLPVDRVFSVPGFGTVVTGTLWSGRIRPEDVLELWPKGRTVRVRGIEIHGERVAEALPGARTALNLAGIERSEIQRGDVLAGPGALRPTRSVSATLRLLPGAPPLRSGQRFHFHSGAKEAMVQPILLDREELLPGEEGYVRLRFAEEVVLGYGDRYILRGLTPLTTLAGGLVLDPEGRARRHRSEDLEELRLRRDPDPTGLLLRVLEQRGPIAAAGLARLVGRPEEDYAPALAKLREEGVVLLREGYWYTPGSEDAWLQRLLAFLERYHGENPRRSGAHREEIRRRLFGAMDIRFFTSLLLDWERAGAVRVVGERVAAADFQVKLSPREETWREGIREAFGRGGLAPPDPAEVRRSLGVPPDVFDDLLGLLAERGELVRVAADIWIERRVWNDMVRRVREYLTNRGGATVAELRDLLGTTRKYMVPILEHLDERRVTRRSGELRVLGADLEEAEELGEGV